MTTVIRKDWGGIVGARLVPGDSFFGVPAFAEGNWKRHFGSRCTETILKTETKKYIIME